MGRIAPDLTPPLPVKGLVLELVEFNTNWYPPKGVTTVLMEIVGAGQGGASDSNGYGYGGMSGDIVNRVVNDVTEATLFQVTIGTGGTRASGMQYGNPGGDTSVVVKGVNYSALGGGKTGNRRGVQGAYNQGGNIPCPPPFSLLLGVQNRGFGDSPRNAVGGCSPLGFGSDGNKPASLGGGGYSTGSSSTIALGANGYVLFGYYLP